MNRARVPDVVAASAALWQSCTDSAAGAFDDGAHPQEYWTAHAGAEMRWLGDRLQ